MCVAVTCVPSLQAKWGVFKEAGVKFPLQGYPQLPSPPPDQPRLPTTLPNSGCSICCGQACQPAAAQQCKLPGEQQQHQPPPLQQQQQARQQAAQAVS